MSNLLRKDTTTTTSLVVVKEAVTTSVYAPGSSYNGLQYWGYSVPSGKLAYGPVYNPAEVSGSSELLSWFDPVLHEDVIVYGTIPKHVVIPGHYEYNTTPAVTWTRSDVDLHLGWNAGARSSYSIPANGLMSFFVPTGVVGVVAGLSYEEGSAATDYTGIGYGIYCAQGVFRVVESGAFRTTAAAYTGTDSFAIERVGSTITYLHNGVVIRTVAGVLDLPLVADAALYAGGDSVQDVALVDSAAAPACVFTVHAPATAIVSDSALSVSFSKGYAGFTAQSGLAHNGVYATSNDVHAAATTLTAVSTLAYSVDRGYATFVATSALSAAAAHSSQGVYGALAPMVAGSATANISGVSAVFSGITALATSGVETPSCSVITSYFGLLGADASSLVGATTTASTMALPSMTAIVADHAYANISGGLSSLRAIAIAPRATPVADPYSGCCAIFTPYGSGSGSLLKGGRAILTAAHVVADLSPSDYEQVLIRFKAADVVLDPYPRVSSILIHPKWQAKGGYDIAVILLDTPVDHPLIAQYDLWRSQIDFPVGTVGERAAAAFTKYGFSPYVDPETGVTDYNSVDWHYVENEFEAYNDEVTSGLTASLGETISDYEAPLRSMLVYDYDNGNAVNDALSYAINSIDPTFDIGAARPGDSGSAAFFWANGGTELRIAAVTSFGVRVSASDVTSQTDASYGELVFETRASSYSEWVDAALPSIGGLSLQLATVVSLHATVHSPGVMQLRLPSPALKLYSGAALFVQLPMTIAAEATVGVGSSLSLTAVSPRVTLSGVGPSIGSLTASICPLAIQLSTAGHFSLPLASTNLVLSGYAQPIAETGISLPQQITLFADVIPTIVGQLTLPLNEVSLQYGALILELPTISLSLDASGQATNVVAYSFNIRTTEATTYSNYAFDYIIRLGHEYYGVRADGLYQLVGETDNGAAIQATAITTEHNLGTDAIKRVPFVYTDSLPGMTITSVADGVRGGACPVEYKGQRVALPRGVTGRYWSFEFSSRGGKPMRVGDIDFKAEKLSRKV